MTALLPAAAAERLRELPLKLKQCDGFPAAVLALAQNQPACFDGVWGSGCALLTAALSNQHSGPLLAVCPTQQEADDLTADLELFGRPAWQFPAWETSPEEGAIRDEVYGTRLRTLKQIAGRASQEFTAAELSSRANLQAELDPVAGSGQSPNLQGCATAGLPSSAEPSPAAPLSKARRQRTKQKVAPEPKTEQPSEDLPRPNLPQNEAVFRPLIVTSITALLQPVPQLEQLTSATRTLRQGASLDLPELLRWLVERGFHATSAVELPGEFSHRGGILDLFAPDWLRPVRVELFDDQIESLREFEVATQRSLQPLASCEVTSLPAALPEEAGCLTDYLATGSAVLLVEPEKLREEGKNYLQRVEQPEQFHSVQHVLAACARLAVATASHLAAGAYGAYCRLGMESVERFSGDLNRVKEELDHVAHADEAFVIVPTTAEVQRLGELLGGSKLAASGRLNFVVGSLREGFRLPREKLLVITGSELFHRGELRRLPRRHLGKAIDSFLDLREDDLVVHLGHGIGRYRGLRQIDKQGQKEEHLEIEFDGGTKLYVPAIKIDLVQKYVGGTKLRPTLAKIGGKSWAKQRQAAEEAVRDLAVEMLQMQAMRASRPGVALKADSEWQREFDASFPYRETPDQLSAIAAIKADLERPRPMDRLLCGDVGFGKTEVAMRAAFKAVDNGFQVAVLAPTTVLCEQHYKSFRERTAEFPFDIARLSRFCTPQEQRDALAGVKSGRIDIVIGTHRVASSDVEFHNLGLVIIDEEQRFGVDVKERLKQLRAMVDVLTLSATPIPRTLHMSLVGLRDISNLESPPEDRMAVETRVTRWDNDLIRHAILRELSRGGQIYFVHNRVNDIEIIEQRLKHLVPEARIRIGHAQMADDELEQVMFDFVDHQFDLLLSTTIVESGLDIPNANTMFIDEADRFGLADMHQLRGRVGRYKHRAYCYLLTDPARHLTPNASRRLKAIEEFSEMGAGFAISMRDLEIRGAGNLLGSQQSGHIAAVGYEHYCQLLENAVRHLQQMPPKLRLEVDINLPGEAYLPDVYIPDLRLKVDLYRRLTRIGAYQDLSDLRGEMRDRFGAPPRPVERLLEFVELKMDAAIWSITAIFREEAFVVLHYSDRGRIEQLARRHKGKVRVVDGRSAYLPLPAGLTDPDQLLQLVKSVLRVEFQTSPSAASTADPIPNLPPAASKSRPITNR